VSIATPDHWHAIPTIEACRRGKDVHIEKPLSLTIREGRAMVEAARRYERVVQTGSEARSQASCRFACELVRNGRIGRVREVYVGGVGGPSSMTVLPAEPVPPHFDWDMWLGPAPWRPYNKGYHPRSWRGYYDFSGGGLTDWGAHHFDLAQWALGMDSTGPVEIIPPDGKKHKFLTFIYANGVRMYHVLNGQPDVEMLSAVTIIGTEGRVGLRYGGIERTDPPSLMKEVFRPDEVHLHQCPPGGHEAGDFLTSVRNRSRPGADVEIGHRSICVSHLAHIAYRLGRPLRWDPVKEEFPGDEEANRQCARAMREPWRL
jgi:predicted dehydrogenase